MITLHKLNGTEFMINAELIEALEPRGAETLVCLATGNKYAVTEPAAEITKRVLQYRADVAAKAQAQGKPVNPIAGYQRDEP